MAVMALSMHTQGNEIFNITLSLRFDDEFGGKWGKECLVECRHTVPGSL